MKQLDGESPNDRNDRAIRAAAAWYTRRLQQRMRVILLTNDADNRRKAAAEGIDARGILVRNLLPTILQQCALTCSQSMRPPSLLPDLTLMQSMPDRAMGGST